MKALLGFFATVVAIAALAGYFGYRWNASRDATAPESHAWLHEQLGITDSQRALLDPIEDRFTEQRQELERQLSDANRSLATALDGATDYTPAIESAVGQVHQIQGQLQQLTIEHILEMRRALTPAQGDRLMQLARQALEESP